MKIELKNESISDILSLMSFASGEGCDYSDNSLAFMEELNKNEFMDEFDFESVINGLESQITWDDEIDVARCKRIISDYEKTKANMEVPQR